MPLSQQRKHRVCDQRQNKRAAANTMGGETNRESSRVRRLHTRTYKTVSRREDALRPPIYSSSPHNAPRTPPTSNDTKPRVSWGAAWMVKNEQNKHCNRSQSTSGVHHPKAGPGNRWWMSKSAILCCFPRSLSLVRPSGRGLSEVIMLMQGDALGTTRIRMLNRARVDSS